MAPRNAAKFSMAERNGRATRPAGRSVGGGRTAARAKKRAAASGSVHYASSSPSVGLSVCRTRRVRFQLPKTSDPICLKVVVRISESPVIIHERHKTDFSLEKADSDFKADKNAHADKQIGSGLAGGVELFSGSPESRTPHPGLRGHIRVKTRSEASESRWWAPELRSVSSRRWWPFTAHFNARIRHCHAYFQNEITSLTLKEKTCQTNILIIRRPKLSINFEKFRTFLIMGVLVNSKVRKSKVFLLLWYYFPRCCFLERGKKATEQKTLWCICRCSSLSKDCLRKMQRAKIYDGIFCLLQCDNQMHFPSNSLHFFAWEMRAAMDGEINSNTKN